MKAFVMLQWSLVSVAVLMLSSSCAHAVQTKDDEDPDLEHGKAMDDMWALHLNKYTVSATDTSTHREDAAT